MANPATLNIDTLIGGGLVMGYHCGSKCRHCLYGSGPHRKDESEISDEAVAAVLDQLKTKGPRAHYHVGGGEPFLQIPRLKKIISGFADRGLALDYVETNASWVKNEDHAMGVLADLEQAGLVCVLVSVSPFHAEFIPPKKTFALIEAADKVLPRGAFVWIPEFLRELRTYDPEVRLPFDKMIEEKDERYTLQLGARYSLVPAGRAGRYYWQHGLRRPWKELVLSKSCLGNLENATHFHVDLRGNYVPGLCAGFVLPFEKIGGVVDLEPYPLLKCVVQKGVGALVEYAQKLDFKPNDTYSSQCDLCTHARIHLFHSDKEFAELGPPGFYDPQSIPGY